MDPEFRKYAPYGLLLSGIAILFSAAYYFVVRKFDIPLQLGLAFIVIGIALICCSRPRKSTIFFYWPAAKVWK